jgi:hypothetical protein
VYSRDQAAIDLAAEVLPFVCVYMNLDSFQLVSQGVIRSAGKQRLGAIITLLVRVLCYAMLCCAVLCCAVLCCAVLCCAVLCCAVLCCAVLRCAVLCCAALHCAVLCCAILLLACMTVCLCVWLQGFNLAAMPSAFILALVAKLELRGLWMGMIIGYSLISAGYGLTIKCLNWQSACAKALQLSGHLNTPVAGSVPRLSSASHSGSSAPLVRMPAAQRYSASVHVVDTSPSDDDWAGQRDARRLSQWADVSTLAPVARTLTTENV